MTPLFLINVAGSQFKDLTPVLPIIPDTPIQLQHEPDNRYDPNAIKVILAGTHIGYIPKQWCDTVKDTITAHPNVEAKIHEYDPSLKPAKQITIKFYLP